MEIPNYLKKYDEKILQNLKILSVDVVQGTFKYQIEYHDPTDHINRVLADGTRLDKKSAVYSGTFTLEEGMISDESEDFDLEPEIKGISFGGLAVSNDMWMDVHDEIYSIIKNVQ